MQDAVKYWMDEYERKGFVRWSVIDKNSNEAIGTIELFHRMAKDYFNTCGILRMDLRTDYENQNCIFEILSLIVVPAYDQFHCNRIATKAAPFAMERIQALRHMDFKQTKSKLIGHDGMEYENYWICMK